MDIVGKLGSLVGWVFAWLVVFLLFSPLAIVPAVIVFGVLGLITPISMGMSLILMVPLAFAWATHLWNIRSKRRKEGAQGEAHVLPSAT